MTRVLVFVLFTACVIACNRGGTQVFIPPFERPSRIDLLCADIQEIEQDITFDVLALLPLEICGIDDDQLPENYEPDTFGQITQVQRGEVISVNFTEEFVVNTNRSVPGFTGVIVDEQPTGIRISDGNPEYTYVSSFSAKTLQAYPSLRILGAERDTDGNPLPPAQRVALDAGPAALELYESLTITEPEFENGVLVPDSVELGVIQYRWLFVALPDLGQVVQAEWIAEEDGSGTFGLPTAFTLPTASCPVEQVVPAPDTENDYNRICPETPAAIARDVKQVDTTITCVDGRATGPRPVDLHLDDGGTPDDPTDDLLLVADANQPLIHRFTLGENGILAEADPINIGTPTTAVVTTPFVPPNFDNPQATQRYLYAISTVDDSVVGVDYTDGATFGAVLPVLAGVTPRANEEGVESRNRVRSQFANARTIEVVTPDYELTDVEGSLQVPLDSLCGDSPDIDPTTAQNPREMRGVFLAVSLAEGNLIFLDVYDLNAPCRGGSCDTETESDAFASIRRHRRRLEAPPAEFIQIEGTPALVFDASQGTLNPDDGTARNSDGPFLEFITCPPAQEVVFGAAQAQQGLICSSTQVWSTPIQRWDATWDGVIPNSDGGLGRFQEQSPTRGEGSGRWLVAGDVPFCEVGVLGQGTELPGYPQQASDTPANTEYAGDRLLIAGPLPNVASSDESFCDSLFGDIEDEIDDLPVWFPILRAFNDELELGPSPNPNRYSFDDILTCFTGFTDYEVRTQDAYSVVGTTTGFTHRVIPASADDVSADVELDECILDPDRPIGCNRDTSETRETTTEPFLQACSETNDVIDVDTVLTGRAFPEVQYINPFVSFEIGPFQADAQPTDSTIAVLTFSIFNGFFELLQPTDGGGPSLPSSMLYSPDLGSLYFVDLQSGVRQLDFDPLSTVVTFQ